MIVLDACVIIAYLDPAHRKNQAAIDILVDAAGQDKVMSAVTAAESMVHRARLGSLLSSSRPRVSGGRATRFDR